MNEKLNFIFKRRSIRAYTEQPVPNDLVQDLLEAAMAAPSAVAKDPWRIVVVQDKQRLQQLADGLPNGKMLAAAGLGLVVCGELTAAHDQRESYMLQDCSAAIENILLAASALELGACWLGVHPRSERMAYVRETLGAPESITPVAVVAIGWPGETKPARTRFDATKVHQEIW